MLGSGHSASGLNNQPPWSRLRCVQGIIPASGQGFGGGGLLAGALQMQMLALGTFNAIGLLTFIAITGARSADSVRKILQILLDTSYALDSDLKPQR